MEFKKLRIWFVIQNINDQAQPIEVVSLHYYKDHSIDIWLSDIFLSL
jgi:hypothetical protein